MRAKTSLQISVIFICIFCITGCVEFSAFITELFQGSENVGEDEDLEGENLEQETTLLGGTEKL